MRLLLIEDDLMIGRATRIGLVAVGFLATLNAKFGHALIRIVRGVGYRLCS